MTQITWKGRSIKGVWIYIVLIFLTGLFAGLMWGGTGQESVVDQVQHTETVTEWTCSMHPQIRQPNPGRCPICSMDLIPVENTSASGNESAHTMEPYARKLAEIEVTKVENRSVIREITLSGKIDYDETRVSAITAWVSGRLDRLFVDYTGIPVRKGDHLAEIYSPELLVAQQELIQAVRAAAAYRRKGLTALLGTADATVNATREKLRLLGLTSTQISRIETSGNVSDHLTLTAPSTGIVIQKFAREGNYITTGTPICTIADLSTVWVLLQAYESDLAWLRYGEAVTFSVPAYPGTIFNGSIIFVDPVLNESTRTVTVRAAVSNSDGKLKPGMFAKGMIHAVITGGSDVLERDLSELYICPMHPEEIHEKPGQCSICGMALELGKRLGYQKQPPGTLPLVIPATAPLLTGKRAIVYVQDPDDEGTFEPRQIVLGVKAGNDYVVLAGLKAGEFVVTRGAFKIDSTLQIQGKPSMMNGIQDSVQVSHAGEEEMSMTQDMGAGNGNSGSGKQSLPKAFLTDLKPMFDAYFSIQQSLSEDALEPAKAGATGLFKGVMVSADDLTAAQAQTWSGLAASLRSGAKKLQGTGTLVKAREAFRDLSIALDALREAGMIPEKMFKFHCPMAFSNAGADWLQRGSELRNPYFGSAMLLCGSLVEAIPGPAKAKPGE